MKRPFNCWWADVCDIVKNLALLYMLLMKIEYEIIIKDFIMHFQNIMKILKVFYACKANTNLAVMSILKDEGCCIDTVSPGEVYTAKN